MHDRRVTAVPYFLNNNPNIKPLHFVRNSVFLPPQGKTPVRPLSQLKMGLLGQTDSSSFTMKPGRDNPKCSEATNKQLTVYRFANLLVLTGQII